MKDYEKFIRKDRKREWPGLDFKQRDGHPAVMVSWDDAAAFCAWLTEEERKKGVIGKKDRRADDQRAPGDGLRRPQRMPFASSCWSSIAQA